MSSVTNPTLALNLAGINYFSTEHPFIDIQRSASAWCDDSWVQIDAATLAATGVLDENGWPTALPDGETQLGCLLDAGNFTAGETHVLLYDGKGSISFFNATVSSSDAGRIVFVPGAERIGWAITATDPDADGSYIRNVAIVPQGYETLYLAGGTFNPVFCAKVAPAREYRFMDWSGINGSQEIAWSDRMKPSHYTWTPAPLEIQVALCNQMGVDFKGVLPAMADDAYVTQYGTYVHEHLDPGLRAHIEYGNELWNFQFGDGRPFGGVLGGCGYCDYMAKALWGPDVGAGPRDFQVLRTTQVGTILEAIWGDDVDRLSVGLGVQTADGDAFWLQYRQLGTTLWEGTAGDAPAALADWSSATTYALGRICRRNGSLFCSAVDGDNLDHQPDDTTPASTTEWTYIGASAPWDTIPDFTDPRTVIDEALGTCYFGYSVLTSDTKRDQLLAAIGSMSFDDAADWLRDQLLSEGYAGGVPDVAAQLAVNKAVTEAAGIDLALYEGGNHTQQGWAQFQAGYTSDQIDQIDDFLIAWSRTSQCADVYEAMWDAVAAVPIDGSFMQYFDIGAPSRSGAWGMFEDTADASDRSDRLLALNAGTEPWFDDGRDAKPVPMTVAVIPDAGGVAAMGARGGTIANGSGEGCVTLPGSYADYLHVRSGGTVTSTHRTSGAVFTRVGCQTAALVAAS